MHTRTSDERSDCPAPSRVQRSHRQPPPADLRWQRIRPNKTRFLLTVSCYFFHSRNRFGPGRQPRSIANRYHINQRLFPIGGRDDSEEVLHQCKIGTAPPEIGV